VSARVDVLLWARRITGRRTAAAHALLEINADASLDDAQNAFHKIARMAHPDLHRTTLTADELELVTTAYALAAAAYQQFRIQKVNPNKAPAAKKPGEDRTKRPSGGVVLPGGGIVGGRARPISSSPSSTTHTPAPAVTAKPAPAPAPPSVPSEPVQVPASQQMSGKALVHYRKAESALRQGDLRAAVLSLKMAIAADPQSAFLRTALSEVLADLSSGS
jgi:tetratricopeptide (TPR) repeat protein